VLFSCREGDRNNSSRSDWLCASIARFDANNAARESLRRLNEEGLLESGNDQTTTYLVNESRKTSTLVLNSLLARSVLWSSTRTSSSYKQRKWVKH
jgi:hypothetical protein